MQQIAQRMILIGKLKMNTLTINFFLRKRKTCIVYFTVKVNGKSMRERSTGIAVLPESWDERSQAIIGNDSENETLSIIKNGTRSTYNKLKGFPIKNNIFKIIQISAFLKLLFSIHFNEKLVNNIENELLDFL